MAQFGVIEYVRGAATKTIEFVRGVRTFAIQFKRGVVPQELTGTFTKPEIPNIVLVMSDDLGNEMHGFYDAENNYPGTFLYPTTPNLDTLASEGVRFEHCYVDQVCSATRAQVYCGKNNSRLRIATHVQPAGFNGELDLDVTLPNIFRAAKAAGHRVGMFGKWHLARDIQEIIDSGRDPTGALGDEHVCSMGADIYQGIMRNPANPPFPGAAGTHNNYYRTSDTPTTTAARTAETDYVTERAFDDAIAWIENAGGTASPDDPFVCVIAASASHNPFEDTSKPPDSLIPAARQAQFPSGDDPFVLASAGLEAIDTLIGRLRTALEAEGKWDNTIFIYIGDNGTDGVALNAAASAPHSQNLGGYAGAPAKGNPYILGCRVPLVVTGPEPWVRGAGRVDSNLVSGADIYPTIMQWLRRKPGDEGYPTDLDGVSFARLLQDSTATATRNFALSHQYAPNGPYLTTEHTSDDAGLRYYHTDGDLYSLIRIDGAEEFYNFTDDFHEATPLALSGAAYTAAKAILDAELAKAE